MSLNDILTICLVVLFIAVIGLALAYIYLTYKNKQKENVIQNKDNNQESKQKQKGGTYNKLYVFDFMQFDKVEDNMMSIITDFNTYMNPIIIKAFLEPVIITAIAEKTQHAVQNKKDTALNLTE